MSSPLRVLVLVPCLALACTSAHPLDDWSDAELCPTSPATLSLIPRPRDLASDAAPYRLSARTLRLDANALELPALADVARVVGATWVDASDESAGLTVLALGEDAVQEVSRRCGVALPTDAPEAYHLVTAGDRALIAARTPEGRARAAALLAELWTDTLPQVRATDWPGQALRGVLEGFYGPAWSFEERNTMLEFTWRARMNTLVWAPKAELLSRSFWRVDYPGELLQHLRDLASHAAALGITLCAELSPGLDIVYSDPVDRARIVSKLDRLAELGVPCLALAFDDIPRELRGQDVARYPGGVGDAQAELVAEIFAALAAQHPQLRLGFVPVDYSTQAMRAHPEYTRAVAARLPRSVFLGWTGVDIVSSTVTAGDVEEVAALWGRPALMGDNYPVTDGSREDGRLQLGPVTGRDAAAIHGSEGWIANAMSLPHASMIPLGTIADQLWDPEAYAPQDAWSRALDRAAPTPQSRAALQRLAEHARSSALDPREAVEAAQRIEAWLVDPAEAAPLHAYLTSLTTLPAELASLGPLAHELTPWSAALAAYGAAGLELLALTEARARGDAPTEARVAALRSEAVRLARSPVQIGGGVLDGLLERGLTRLDPR